ncbi:MAG: IS1595 family transposase [Planctomycetota bacterium]|nr:IS1595 family transposase [Planctomycetota bacterium]
METINGNLIQFPETLIEAVRQFSDLDYATPFFAQVRWPKGVCCPHCGSVKVDYIANRRLWECREKHERQQFSVKIGTIFEDSKLTIDKCLVAVWMEVNAKNSISSYEVGRHLGVTQKTAWFLQQRIRLAMQVGTFDKMLAGEVEVDETFIGGKARNMHPGKRKAKGRGAVGKAVVMGLLERHGEVRTLVVDNTKRKTLQPVVKAHVEKGAAVFADALASYTALSSEYVHSVIDHAECYVKGNVHTNGLENYWSLFNPCIKGTHISIEPFHLFRYLDAEAFRFNNRKVEDGERFVKVLGSVEGKRLTYKGLIGETQTELMS